MRKPSYNGSDTQRLGNKTMTVGSNFRFENLQRLNTIVGQVSQRNKQQLQQQKKSYNNNNNFNTMTINNKVDMSTKVLDMIKNRIKTNCQRLYDNYDENKKVIMKQIQKVETNMLSENAINKGFDNVVKQKATYDKAKAQLQSKQRKLNKLLELRDDLKSGTTQSQSLIQILNEKCTLITHFQQYKQTLDYQTSVLNNMKSQRRQIKLYMKQKYDRMLADEQFKKQRIKKLENLNHLKRVNLKKIEQQLQKQEYCEIPQQLAGELQKRLQQYQGKHMYENIAKHETIISEQFRRQAQLENMREKQQQRKLRLIKQKQQQKQYELAYNFYLIKQQQQEKIKRICGVSSLGEIVNNTLQADCENLQVIRKQTQRAIQQIRQRNKCIQKQIQEMLTNNGGGQQQQQGKLSNNNSEQQDLLEVQQDFIKTQTQLKGLQINSAKKYEMIDQWHSMVQMMTKQQVKRQHIGDSLKNILQTISELQSQMNNKRVRISDDSKLMMAMDDSNNNNNSLMLNNRSGNNNTKLKSEYQSEYSVIDDKSVM